ncbi:MAG: hypothetical protein R3300_20470 [Candidatus Promineifilaceae bacterium]|nr:hypothetical protein [Candidatus Promineifilaceae bacterium]
MRLLTLGLFVLLLSVPADALAQEEADDTAYWYVSHYQIPWAKVDSLVSLEKRYSPQIREATTPEETGVLDRKVLIHDTGNEWNVVIMTKFPSWEAIRAEIDVLELVFPDEAERSALQEAYGWVFEDTDHWDAIYVEAEDLQN